MKTQKIEMLEKRPVRKVSGTHYARVLNHLKVYGEIDTMTAIREYGNTRLAATILLLRQDGYNIETVPTTGKDRYGDTSHFGTYVLKENK